MNKGGTIGEDNVVGPAGPSTGANSAWVGWKTCNRPCSGYGGSPWRRAGWSGEEECYKTRRRSCTRVTTSRSVPRSGRGGGETGRARAPGGPPGGGGWDAVGVGETDRDDAVVVGAAAPAGRQYHRPAEGGGGVEERQGEGEAEEGDGGAHPTAFGGQRGEDGRRPASAPVDVAASKLLKELLGGLGEEWVFEDMERGRGKGR